MKFQDKVKKHLSEYKTKRFPKTEHGVWKRKDKETPLSYAFKTPVKSESADSDLNLLESYRKDFLKYEQDGRCKIKRHVYFHHMNSSQAMCFNFFYPLLNERKLELITDFLKLTGESIKYETACFEKESKVEVKSRKTYFDFYFETVSGKKFYFEIKYTENEFGTAPKDKEDTKKYDQEHIKKFEDIYKPHLSVIADNFKSQQAFLGNYQIMRNIINVSENSYVVFVYPTNNDKVRQQAEKAKKEMLRKPFDKHIYLVEWDELFEAIKSKVNEPKLIHQYKEFGEKYLDIKED